MGLLPESLGNLQGPDIEFRPPDQLIAGVMQLPVMTAAKGDGEFVADFKADGSRLGKAQVMGIARLPTADETGL